jgi:hypothetical protein
MSEAFDFDLSEVQDFEDVKLEDASDYNDQTGPAPIAPGNYRFRVEVGGRKKNNDGEALDDNGYPQVQLTKLVIVEPEEFAGKEVFPFQSYSLRPQQNGPRKGTVPAVDLLRGFDDTLTFGSGKEVLQLLGEQFENGKTFVAGTNWEAKDSDAIKEFIEENGGDLDDVDQDEKRAFFKKAIIRGQKKFPKVNGYYVPEIEGPSGATLQARVKLTRIYPSSKEVKKMGPAKKTTAAASKQ